MKILRYPIAYSPAELLPLAEKLRDYHCGDHWRHFVFFQCFIRKFIINRRERVKNQL